MKVQQPGLEIWREATRLICEKLPKFLHPGWFEFLAEEIPVGEPRARRDVDRFLSLLHTVALCRSFSDSRRNNGGSVQIEFSDYCVAYEILNQAFASTYGGVHPQALEVAEVVRQLHKSLGRAVTIAELAADKNWERALAYKWTKVAIEHKLLAYESGTQRSNVKRLLPCVARETRFLPHPVLIFRQRAELGREVRFTNPLTGIAQVLRRRAPAANHIEEGGESE